MTESTVRLTVEDGISGRVARLTLDRPAKRNALTPAMIAALEGHALALALDEQLRAVVIRGSGRTFSAGADLDTLASLAPDSAEAFITGLHRAIHAVRVLPVPVIARLSGPCFGAALELAAACDLRAGDPSLLAGMPEVVVGVPSVIEAALLPRLIGWGRAAELVLTGLPMDAEAALSAGLVSSLDGDKAVETWLAAILAAGPLAVRAQKQVMRGWNHDEDGAVRSSIRHFADAYRTDEPSRMIAALRARPKVTS